MAQENSYTPDELRTKKIETGTNKKALVVPCKNSLHEVSYMYVREGTEGIALSSVYSRTGYFSLSFLVADRWNSLPASLRSISSLALFSLQRFL